LKNELEDSRWQHRRLMNEHERLHEHLNERTAWAQSLDRQLQAAEIEMQRLQAAEIEMQRLREQHQHERNLIKSSRWFKLGEAINLGPKLPDDSA